MKKILLLALTTLALTSCDDGMTAKYKKVHIQMDGGVPIHCQVLEWGSASYCSSEIKTQEYGWVIVSSENFMMYSTDKCPICNK